MAGKTYRKGMTLFDVINKFPDEEAAKTWLAEQRWPKGPKCPHCGSDNVQSNIRHKTMTHRCRDCMTGKSKTMFSIKTGTVMEGSNLKYRIWAIGIYLFTTNIKGISSMKLHRELGIGQKAAWFMLHRLRKAYELEVGPFDGPVEVDETYIGGKRKNMSNAKRKALKEEGAGRGAVGKQAVAGIRDRKTRKIKARKIEDTTSETLHDFVLSHTSVDAAIYTDDHRSYQGLPNHKTVKHSVSQYVNKQAHTNGIESFWALLKRGYHGTFHHISEKHLDRYIGEFAGRYNDRELDTLHQMEQIAKGLEGKRLKYRELVA